MVNHPSIYPQFSGDILSRTNIFSWFREFIRNNQLEEGYYLEFGVLNGESIIDAYRQIRGHVTSIYGFDTFEGLPSVLQDSSDQLGTTLNPLSANQGTFKTMDVEEVHRLICLSCRIDPNNLKLVKGLFSDTLPKFDTSEFKGKGPLLGVYVDCTLYSATKQVLDFVSPFIETGTWLFFDDYWTFRGSPFHGPQKAIREWLSEHPELGIQDHMNFRGFGKAFIAYKNDCPDV